MNYKIINTGSNGNATVIEDIILIDCGVSFKKLENYYRKLKIVFLTHSHGDHFNKTTIKKLAKERPTLRFACCDYLVNYLVESEVSKKNIDILEIGKMYDYKEFKVSPITLYHDVPNCGYRLFINDKKVMYATDTNTLEGIIAKDYDLYLIEANYNDKEIEERIKNKVENNEFAYELRAKENHLSENQTNDFLINNMGDGSNYVFMHEHVERKKVTMYKIAQIGIFKEDLEQYQMLLDNYEALSSEDGDTAYKLAKMMILTADRWSEISFNASKYSKETGMSKTDLYNWAYQKYRILITLHEFCRVLYKQCSDNLRSRWND